VAKNTKTTEQVVDIPAINIKKFQITLVGDSPLIVHRFAEKARKELLDKAMQKAKSGREAKNPVKDFVESMYWLSEKPTEYTEEAFEKAIQSGATFGFPSIAFKAAAVAAGYRCGVTKNKTVANGAFHIDGEFVEIKGLPEMREDVVRLSGMGSPPDIRYRGEFKEWEATFTVKYNASVFSAEQVINLFNLGGFACGIGEWRPEKSGSYGMYHVK
jgi:hypothetical protein